MSQSESHAIRNGIIATVVGGLILASLSLIWAPAKAALAWCWRFAATIWNALISTHAVPGWLVLVLVVTSVAGVFIFIAQLIRKSSLRPSYLSYVKDSIYGVNWHWSWSGNRISNLWAACPNCQGQLVYINDPDGFYTSNPHVKLLCENCNSVISKVKGVDHSHALASIEREIFRRIRVAESSSESRAS